MALVIVVMYAMMILLVIRDMVILMSDDIGIDSFADDHKGWTCTVDCGQCVTNDNDDNDGIRNQPEV